MKHVLYKQLLSLTIILVLSSCASSFLQTVKTESQTIELADQVYLLLAGEFATEEGKFEDASNYYEEAAYLSEDESVFSVALALAIRNNDDQKAVRIGEQWHQLNPNSLLMHQAMVLIYIRLGEYDKALPHIEFTVDHNDRLFRQEVAREQLLPSKQGEGNQLISALLARYPDNSRLLLIRALYTMRSGDYRAGFELTQRALEIDPSFVQAHAVAADALFSLGQVERGLALLQQQRELHPDNAQLLLKVARAHFLYDRNVEALSFYRQFYHNHKDVSEVYYALGVLHLQLNQFASARRFFSQFAESSKKRTNDIEYERAIYYLARVDEAEGNYQEALSRYNSIGVGPLFLDARVGIARVFSSTKDYRSVAAEFERARKQAVDDRTRIALFIAQAEMMRDFATNAQIFAVYKRALSQYVNELNLLYSRAMFTNDINRFDLAEKDLKQIIKLDPANWRALNALGYLLADSNRKLQEAKKYVQQAYKLQPYNSAVIDSVGWVEFRLANFAEAEKYIRLAADMHSDPEILGHLAEVFWSQQKEDEAIAILERALNRFPDNEYLKRLYDRTGQ